MCLFQVCYHDKCSTLCHSYNRWRASLVQVQHWLHRQAPIGLYVLYMLRTCQTCSFSCLALYYPRPPPPPTKKKPRESQALSAYQSVNLSSFNPPGSSSPSALPPVTHSKLLGHFRITFGCFRHQEIDSDV